MWEGMTTWWSHRVDVETSRGRRAQSQLQWQDACVGRLNFCKDVGVEQRWGSKGFIAMIHKAPVQNASGVWRSGEWEQ
jgi:hypothetical protein